MGHQQKAPVQPAQIVRNQLPPRFVQVVGWLVNHGVGPLVQKEGGQQGPGLLPAAEGGEGAVQQFLLQPQLGQLPAQPPLLLGGHSLQKNVHSSAPGIVYRPGPAQAGLAEGYVPPALQFPRQQAEQGGFPPAVPAHKSQLPVGVQLEVQALKNRGVVPLVGEMQILYRNLRHAYSLLSPQKNRKRFLPLTAAEGIAMPNMSRKGKTAHFLSRTHDRTEPS